VLRTRGRAKDAAGRTRRVDAQLAALGRASHGRSTDAADGSADQRAHRGSREHGSDGARVLALRITGLVLAIGVVLAIVL
jgi:hypothetical protein